MLERWFQKIDNIWSLAFQILEILILLAFAIGGFYVCWTILGETEMATLPKLGWSIGTALASVLVGWLAWLLMKIFGSGF